jgi:hypothetical protein
MDGPFLGHKKVEVVLMSNFTDQNTIIELRPYTGHGIMLNKT